MALFLELFSMGMLFMHGESVRVNKTIVSAEAEKTLIIHCDYTKDGDVFWFKINSPGNDTLLASTTNTSNVPGYKIVYRASLKISSLESPRDDGMFECQADGIERVHVTVIVPPQNVSMKTSLDSVAEGDMLVMTCVSFGGKPLPTLRWFLGNQRLLKNVESVADNTRKITIEARKHMNGNKLTCEAKNTAGSINSSTSVNVTYKPEVNISYSDLWLAEGDQLQLMCIVDSNPKASISWECPQPDTARNNLSISSVTKSHAGNYTCIAHNQEGTAKESVEIKIRSLTRGGDLGTFVPSLVVVVAVALIGLSCGLVFRRRLISGFTCTSGIRSNGEVLSGLVHERIREPQVLEGHYADVVFTRTPIYENVIRRDNQPSEYASIDFHANANMRQK